MPRGQINVKVNVNVYDETDVPDMRDQITESPRRMALSFTAAALSMTVPPGLRPTQQLPVEFRNRWASESDKDSSPPMFQAKSRFYQPTVLSEDGADVKTVCVATNADTLEPQLVSAALRRLTALTMAWSASWTRRATRLSGSAPLLCRALLARHPPESPREARAGGAHS